MKNQLFLFLIILVTCSNVQCMELRNNEDLHTYPAFWRDHYQHVAASGQKFFGCPFCAQVQAHDDAKYFIVYRSTHCYAMLSTNPYTDRGHLIIIPYHHTANVEDLTQEELSDMYKTFIICVKVLRQQSTFDGIDSGGQFGENSGATVPQHIHFQCVPRMRITYQQLAGLVNNANGVIDLKSVYQRLKTEFDMYKSPVTA